MSQRRAVALALTALARNAWACGDGDLRGASGSVFGDLSSGGQTRPGGSFSVGGVNFFGPNRLYRVDLAGGAAGGMLSVMTCSPQTTFDTVVAVGLDRTGSSCNANGPSGPIQWIGSDDDDSSCTVGSSASRIDIPLSSTAVLYIQVNGYNGATGEFVLSWSFRPSGASSSRVPSFLSPPTAAGSSALPATTIPQIIAGVLAGCAALMVLIGGALLALPFLRARTGVLQGLRPGAHSGHGMRVGLDAPGAQQQPAPPGTVHATSPVAGAAPVADAPHTPLQPGGPLLS
jgi:hypothetical protein